MQIEFESQTQVESNHKAMGSSNQKNTILSHYLPRLTNWLERISKSIFLWPAVLALLFLSIFPLIVSFYISLSRFSIAVGGFELKYVGLDNYHRLLFGREQVHFLGLFAPSTPLNWLIFGLAVVALAVFIGLGESAAIAYMLLFLVTFIGVSYIMLIRHRVMKKL